MPNVIEQSITAAHPTTFAARLRSVGRQMVSGIYNSVVLPRFFSTRTIFPVGIDLYARAYWKMHPDTIKSLARDPDVLDADTLTIRLLGLPVQASTETMPHQMQLTITANFTKS